MQIDVLIFGGGGAGLWLLDELHRQGYSTCLLESHALGTGQTIASQGIIHGGLKYTLSNLIDPGAKAIANMPLLWRECLAGKSQPNLSQTQLRTESCHLWRTGSAKSRFGMTGARMVLRVKPQDIALAQWPSVLQGLDGSVYRLDEQVIQTDSFLQALADAHQDRLLKINPKEGLAFQTSKLGHVEQVTLAHEDHTLTLRPRKIVFAAGQGNAALRQSVGLDPALMQTRPLHMVMVRGLPKEAILNGHCTDFSQTRVTITTDHDSQGRVVWQVGGQISEDGINMEPTELIHHAKAEIQAVIPNVDLSDTQWATFRVNRAEAHTRAGRRPEGVTLFEDGNVITAWPTKLALVPQLAADLLHRLDIEPAEGGGDGMGTIARNWPRPQVALPPWETATSWITVP